MKLKIFRIINLILLALALLLGIFFAVSSIYLESTGQYQDSSFIILLIAILVGCLFLSFEMFFVFQSFKHGTLLLYGLCKKNGSNYKKLPTLIVSLILLIASLGGIIFNILIYLKVLPLNQSMMMIEFNCFYFFLIFVNALVIVLYWLFIVQDDMQSLD